MKTVRFIRTGEAIPDIFMKARVDEFIASDHTEWDVSNWLTMDYFRVARAQKVIKEEDYTFLVEDLGGVMHEFTIDDTGRCPDWYDSTEIWGNLLSELLTIRY